MTDAILIEQVRFAYPPLTPDAASPWVIDGLDLGVGQGEWRDTQWVGDDVDIRFHLFLQRK